MKRNASSARRRFELGAKPGERDWIRLILSCGVFMRGVGHERRSEDTGSVSRESWRPAVGASRDSGIRQRIGRPRQERLSARAAQAWRWVPNQGRCQTHVAEQLPCGEQTPLMPPCRLGRSKGGSLYMELLARARPHYLRANLAPENPLYRN